MQLLSKSASGPLSHQSRSGSVKLLWIGLLAIACPASVVVAESFEVVETDDLITVTRGDNIVVTYNKVSPPAPSGIDKIYERSGCLHPVVSPQGKVVTEMFPFDHPHQHGIFSAWVKTTYDGQPIDFWNLAGRTGRVLHERVVSKFQEGDAAGFEVDLIHRVVTEPPVDVLRERWKITVYPTNGTYHCFDLETTQAAITDKPLKLSEYHYGGIVLRGPTRWLTAKDSGARKHPDLVREPSGFLNDLGSDRVKGNHQHAKWVALSGKVDGKPVSIAVLSHEENFRAPQASRLHPSKPYFCFAPCVDGSFQIDRDHPFEGHYRYLVMDTAPDEKWIAEQWETWVGVSGARR
ncbi:MAG: PmoA family protein [Planctomycetes bacterium]|nr:PmoA family protein [Planctomycetota bacterium]